MLIINGNIASTIRKAIENNSINQLLRNFDKLDNDIIGNHQDTEVNLYPNDTFKLDLIWNKKPKKGTIEIKPWMFGRLIYYEHTNTWTIQNIIS